MSLANALLFGLGLSAMAVPLWVHLRLGKVKKRAVVPTLRLMRATPQTSKSPRRFVDIPLLLMRLLLLLLVALGFGRLLVPWLKGKDAVEHVVMVMDVSGSMQAQDGKVWEQARNEALAGLNKLHASSQVAVVLSPQGQSRPEWESPAQAIRRIKNLTPGYGANRLSGAIRSANQLLTAASGDDHPKVLHLVSDFQRSALVDIDRASIPSDVELRISKAGDLKLANRGIAVTVAAAGMSDVGLYAFQDGGTGTLKLEENGKASALAITPGQDAARLAHTGAKPEWITRHLSLQEKDALAADNDAWDVFYAQEELPVWLWEPVASAKHIYQQSSYYLGRALQPAAEGELATSSRYRPTILTEGDLATALAKTGSAGAPRLMFVPATAAPSTALVALVRKLVESGGSVVFFGGPEIDPAAYDTAFGPLLGIKLGKPVEIELAPALAAIKETHPLWGELDAASRAQLAAAPLQWHHSVEAAPAAKVLASYADHAPFVVAAKPSNGKGRVIFVNTSANRAWGDWPASAPQFVPAMHLLAAHALDAAAATLSHPPVSAGEPTSVQLAPQFAGKNLMLDDQRLPIDPQGRVKQAFFAKPGVTELTLDDGTSAGKLAVNFPPTESTLECDTPAVVRQRLESLRQHGGSPAVRWEDQQHGSLAWKLCMAAAAFLLVIEPVIANRRKFA